MRACLATAYLSLGLVAATAVWLGLRSEAERWDDEQHPGTARFADVRASDGATLRVEGGRLELAGPKPPGHSWMVGFVRGPGVPARVLVLLVALGASTAVLAVMVVAMVRRDRARMSCCRVG